MPQNDPAASSPTTQLSDSDRGEAPISVMLGNPQVASQTLQINCGPQPSRVTLLRDVPSYMSPNEVLRNTRLSCHLEGLTHLQFLFSQVRNHYSLLFLHTDSQSAELLHHSLHNQPLCSLGPDQVFVRFVQTIQYYQNGSKEVEEATEWMGTNPMARNSEFDASSHQKCSVCLESLNFPSSPLSCGAGEVGATPPVVGQPRPGGISPIPDLSFGTSPLSDETPPARSGSGFSQDGPDPTAALLVTLPCTHTFHCPCLANWAADTCPVCRFNHHEACATCFECNSAQDLWMCLLCGCIGCGRYSAAHQEQHFNQTGHAFAMNLDNKRVWDYVGDGYVHRIAMSGNKLVEVSEIDSGSKGRALDPVEAQMMTDAKFESQAEHMSSAFSRMLTEQMEEQAQYFEERLNTAEEEGNRAVDELTAANRELEARNRELREGDRKAQSALQSKTDACKKAEREMGRVETELDEETTLGKRLAEDVRKLETLLKGASRSKRPKGAPSLDALKEEVRAMEAEVEKLMQQMSEGEAPPDPDSAPAAAPSPPPAGEGPAGQP